MSTRSRLRVAIGGGSGSLGTTLARHFHAEGHDVTVIAWHAADARWRTVVWDGRTLGDWQGRVDGADVVINLAGRSVNCRYTPANRQAIKGSRIESTRVIGQAIAAAQRPPPLWMNASTATIYRHTFDRPMDEATGEFGGAEPDAPARWRFSIDVATSWEDALFDAPASHTRKVALRMAIIMTLDRGGAFDLLLRLARLGLGGTVGDGEQFVSWLHVDDLVRAACRAPFGLPATRGMLEIASFFLRTETELLLKSRRVVPARLLDAGFDFRHPLWSEAAADLVRRHDTARQPQRA